MPVTQEQNAEATRKLLDQLWQRNLPTLHSRLALFDAVAAAAESSTLTPALRTQAAGEAHKLAGSLGMFGYSAGTDRARELEQYFESTAPADTTHVRELTAALRTALPPEATL